MLAGDRASDGGAMPVRNLVVTLGDQLGPDGSMLDGHDPARDAVWMAEAHEESTHVWSHRARIALFLSAMRHHAAGLRARGVTVHYHRLGQPDTPRTLAEGLSDAIRRLRPQRVVITEPGDWRVEQALKQAAGPLLEIRPCRHFYTSRDELASHSRGRRRLRQEDFYRSLRRKHRVLMDGDDPCGGKWSYDAANRASFGKSGPGEVPEPLAFPPDDITREVMRDVEAAFPGHPGSLSRFDWPVTRAQALAALDDFITHRLPRFGRHQDAMWAGRSYLYHSRLSAALNLKLLGPREVVDAAERAYRDGQAPLESAEGFIRQILGWREYVRGLYWMRMPGFLDDNALGATLPLPAFYWDGQTPMRCLREVLAQTLELGYAHHIQRLMVAGLYPLLLGVQPRQVHEWFLAIYVDAVEWAELPNVLGMSQYADGGVMATKPYAASGSYISRMSNYCQGCAYDPKAATGPRACPFTTLYWDFLMRHERLLSRNVRMMMQLRSLQRLGDVRRGEIREQARRHRLEVLGTEGVT
jgi:deoxyribodipyrimidine photolyase-related protein